MLTLASYQNVNKYHCDFFEIKMQNKGMSRYGYSCIAECVNTNSGEVPEALENEN